MPGSVAPLDMAGVQIPYHFRCPISLELMRDPVTVSTGQTYDRSSIESWVATGNTTCPVTRAPLEDFTLIPNHTLRRLIQEWCVAHRSLGVERIPTPKHPADPSLLRSLVAQSASSSAPLHLRLAALRRLRSFGRDSDANRLLIADSRSALLSLVFNGGGDGDCPSTTDLTLESLAVVSMLPLSEEESAVVASRPDRLAWLAGLVRSHPCVDVRIHASGLIEAVSAGTRLPEVRITIGSAEGVMEGLVEILVGNSLKAAARAAIKAFFSLCLVKQNRERAVACGATEALVGRIKLGDLDRGDLERALATVELLCRAEGGCEAVAGMGAAGTLVKVMAEGRGSDRAAEHAAGALLAVCGASEAAQREAVAGGVVPQLLVMVQGGCTERAKRKAQVLLKLLWSSAWAHHDSLANANSDDFHLLPQQLQPPTLLRY